MPKGKKYCHRNNIKHHVKIRIHLLDRELEVLQWANFFSVEPTSDFSNRYFPDMVGRSLQRGSNIRAMVRRGENLIQKSVATTCNKIGSIFLHQMEKKESHTLQNTQQGSLDLPLEDERNKKQPYDQIKQKDLL